MVRHTGLRALLLVVLAPLLIAAKPTFMLSIRVIPASGPIDPSDQRATLGKGDTVFSSNLALEDVAPISDSVELSGSGTRVELPADVLLQHGRVMPANRDEWLASVAFYCVSPIGPGKDMIRKAMRLIDKVDAKGPAVFFCLSDEDRDGTFDSTFLVNSKFRVMGTPTPIRQLPYQAHASVTVQDWNRVTIRYEGNCTFGIQLIYDLHRRARMHFRQMYTLIPDEGRTVIDAPLTKGQCRGILPRTVSIMGTRFEILAYDAESDRIEIRRLASFKRSLFDVEFWPREILIPSPS